MAAILLSLHLTRESSVTGGSQCGSEPGPFEGHVPDGDDKDASSDECDDETAPETDITCDKEAKQESADQGPDKARGDISDEAIAGALHHEPSGPSGKEAHDQPGHDATRVKNEVCKQRIHGTPPNALRDSLENLPLPTSAVAFETHLRLMLFATRWKTCRCRRRQWPSKLIFACQKISFT
jgi:hypothetical protein